MSMRTFRSLLAGIFFAAYGLGSLLIGVLLFPLLTLAGAAQTKRALVRFSWQILIGTAQLTRMIRLEISSEDRTRLAATRGKVVVANHPTLIDIVLLTIFLPEATGIAKAAAKRNFFYSLIVKGMFLVNDDPEHVLTGAADLLARGVNLVIFPEGTRTPVDGKAHPLRRGAAQIALRAQVPILPVTITCTPPILAKGQPWYVVSDRIVVWRIQVGTEVVPSVPEGSVHAAAVSLTRTLSTALFGV